MQIIDGKTIAATVKTEIANEVKKMIDADLNPPHLAAVLVGNDPASETYIASKERACKEVGFTSSVYRLSENTTEEELLKTIDFLNNDDELDGYILQLPLPKHIDANKIIFDITKKNFVSLQNINI